MRETGATGQGTMKTSGLRWRAAAACLASLVVAACGDAFTAADSDGGPPPRLDASSLDAAIDTGAPDSGHPPERDAQARDALAVDDGPDVDDGPVGVSDASPPIDATALCVKTCPTGFACTPGASGASCIDRATPNFSALANPPTGNWSYGSVDGLGESNFTVYPSHFTAATTLAVWGMQPGAIEPSVFHNSAPTAVTYDAMTVPGGVLGLYAGAGMVTSVVRWVAPVGGTYDVFGAFVGLTKPTTTVTVGVLINKATTGNSVSSLNMYGGGNTFSYNMQAQTLAAGSTVDFLVQEITTADDPAGGASLDARITAD
jgi:hypothetical protein